MKCPRCEKEFDKLLALSRTDNKTMICNDCGMAEAMEDFFGGIEALPIRKQKNVDVRK